MVTPNVDIVNVNTLKGHHTTVTWFSQLHFHFICFLFV